MRHWLQDLDKKERMALVQATIRGVATGAANAIVAWLVRVL